LLERAVSLERSTAFGGTCRWAALAVIAARGTLRTILSEARIGTSGAGTEFAGRFTTGIAAWAGAKLVALGASRSPGLRALFETGSIDAGGPAIFSAAKILGSSSFRAGFAPAGFRSGAVGARFEFALRFAKLGFPVFAFGCLTQVLQFFGVELADIAGFEIEDQWAVTDAADLLDVVTDLFEHFAQFAVAAFDQNDFIPGIIDGARRAAFSAGFTGMEGSDFGGSCLDAI
jgi:hypothetical protein